MGTVSGSCSCDCCGGEFYKTALYSPLQHYVHSIFFLFSSAGQAIVMNQINAQSAGQAIGKLKSHAVTQEMLVMHRKCYLRAGIPREDPVAQNTNASSPSISAGSSRNRFCTLIMKVKLSMRRTRRRCGS